MKDQDTNSFWEWLKKEKYSVGVTLFAAIIPSVLTFWANVISRENQWLNLLPENLSFEKNFYFIQLFFILITLFVLVYYQSRTRRDLVQCKEYIIKYIKKNTNRKQKQSTDPKDAYDLVKASVIQFYRFWIIVWLLWLAYYLGGAIFSYESRMNYGWSIYGKVFDFLNSTAMLLIYIVLVNITVRSEIRRNEDKSITWYGILIWFIIFITFLSLLIYETVLGEGKSVQMNAMLVSSFAAMVFVMVLGKLNSHYLQVPRLFMMIMYFHAIIQMYNPLISLNVKDEQIKDIFLIEQLQHIVPVITLAGKVCLMFTLCWMVNKKRLIFFIIHRSAAMEITQNLLSELEQDPVDL